MKKSINKDTFEKFVIAQRNLLNEFNNCWIGENDVDDSLIEMSLTLSKSINSFLKNVEPYIENN